MQHFVKPCVDYFYPVLGCHLGKGENFNVWQQLFELEKVITWWSSLML